MTIFPLNLFTTLGHVGAYLVFLLIGFAFGYVLEISGFGFSPKLAAQFYFKDLTVLKVMFTAIVVAMVLLFAATAIGLLDYNLLWVNPTYLWPGIVGGLIMGIGFILGGFCPGTSLVAFATFKLDGILFALGVLFGIFVFGETVEYFELFYNSSYMGRFTLPELFGIDIGWVVLGVVIMALFMFWGAEQLERIVGKKDLKQEPKWRIYGALALLAGALFVMISGQPTNTDRWEMVAPVMQPKLDAREIYIHPGELLTSLHDHNLQVHMVDVRSEADYNLFHIGDARLISTDDLQALSKEMLLAAPNTVVVMMSNDEAAATDAWKILAAESVPNIYILEGGINGWLDSFSEDELGIEKLDESVGEDELRYEFQAALGGSYEASDPNFGHYEGNLLFVPKIKLELKRGPSSGGCG